MRKVILILVAVGLCGCATKKTETLSLYSGAPVPVAKGPDPLDKYLAWKKENHPNAEQRPRESYIAARGYSPPEPWILPVHAPIEPMYRSSPSSTTIIGNTAYHSGGRTTTKIGNTFFHSGGSTTTKIGDSYYHSGGQTTTRIGDTFYHSGGATSTKIGNTTYHSGGGTSTAIGGTVYHSGSTR